MDEGMFEPEEWMLGLKKAYEAGYYKTEPATDEQERFPWQDKSCRDCPFWLDTEWCEVFAREQRPTVHTCSYFDAHGHEAARNIIDEGRRQSRRRYWEWISRER